MGLIFTKPFFLFWIIAPLNYKTWMTKVLLLCFSVMSQCQKVHIENIYIIIIKNDHHNLPKRFGFSVSIFRFIFGLICTRASG